MLRRWKLDVGLGFIVAKRLWRSWRWLRYISVGCYITTFHILFLREGWNGILRCDGRRGDATRVSFCLPEFLFADGGYEFLEVEGFEVGYVLEVAGAEGCNCGFQHR